MIEKRFNELYTRAFEKNYNTFTEFLNLDEQSILISTSLPCTRFGGYACAERIIAGFGMDINTDDFPILCIKIRPVNQKFADNLTHRDYLGAIMNLGIKREMIGDIIVNHNTAYLFCHSQIADYILDNLSKIRHTVVKTELADTVSNDIISQPEHYELVVSSLRLDVIISAVYKLSRSETSRLFSNRRVFINSRLTENTSYTVKDNDIISVRGFGRFIFSAQLRTTKKERIVIEILKY